jgi:triosephosphate isomerase
MNIRSKKLIAGNWKLNLNPKAALEYFEAIPMAPSNINSILFIPAYCLTDSVIQTAQKKGYQVGAQNCFGKSQGAFTGELSPQVLTELQASNTLLGHSERRQLFHEDDASLALRLTGVLQHPVHVVYCMGETLDERESGSMSSVFTRQLTAFVTGLKAAFPDNTFAQYLSRITLAYEPVWAIGTGRTATPEQANDAHAQIREILTSLTNPNIGPLIRILYGGSVTPENARGLLSLPEVDGLLVGGASLKSESFYRIIASTTNQS